ncbi:hypothetical protein L1987_16419 [Smallanthus sonchifolius]|uniref:Uncharacterized protein n=1 Tax=Smallanthus sonchifolius TaxID=185202 RepID=A0ACB9JAE5_9ASTR|nr:hypothetical protein L1987_16419 [Smallanthus sonchifolius]
MGRGLCALECFRFQYLKGFFLVNATYYCLWAHYCLYSAMTFSRIVLLQGSRVFIFILLLAQDLTRIKFMTNAILLREMMDDPLLSKYRCWL